MTTKTSSAVSTAAIASVATSSLVAASPPSVTGIKIKKEIANDEIKDFAETAMNELLGWYGYDNVDLSTKSSRLRSSAGINCDRTDINGNKNFHRDDSNTTSDHENSSGHGEENDSISPFSIKTNDKLETNCGWCHRIVPENSPEFLTTTDGPRYCTESCFAQSRRASFKRAKQCDWCRHIRHAVSYVDFQDGASQLQFCSDKCLNQYKMQIFCKETQAHLDMNPHLKEKSQNLTNSNSLITPDLWLKNCRSRSLSPASDISRSPTPLSNKSTILLNNSGQHDQHKPIISLAPVSKLMSKHPTATINNCMNIATTATTVAAISTIPSTTTTVLINNRQSPKHNGRKKRNSSSTAVLTRTSNLIPQNLTNHLVNSHNNTNTTNLKSNKCLMNNSNSNPSNCSVSSKSSAVPGPYPLIQDLRLNVAASVSPNDQVNAAGPSQQQQQQQQLHLPSHNHSRSNLPPPHAYFSHSTNNNNFPPPPPQIRQPYLTHAQHLQSRLLGIPTHSHSHPHYQHQQQHQQQHHQQQQQHYSMPPLSSHLLPPDLNPLASLIGTTPPVTVMVPYPIIIPLPIPIPIPLPIMSFLNAANLPNERNNSSNSNPSSTNHTTIPDDAIDTAKVTTTESQIDKNTNATDARLVTDAHSKEMQNDCDNNEPLDFTKSKIADTDTISKNLDKITNIKLTQNLTSSPADRSEPKNSEESTVVIEQIPPDTDDDNGGGDVGTSTGTATGCVSPQDNINNCKEKVVPKFKITRLHTKRLITKESECSRPLRKRKRIIDCDYNVTRTTSKDSDENSIKLKKL